MKKYLCLEFSDARLFRDFNIKNVKDYYLEYGYPEPRINQSYFVEPITVYQIANMISVLMGERPLPSLRKAYHKRYEPAFEIALNSFIKINDYKYFDEKFGVEKYICESMQIKKSSKNSWNNINNFNWEKVRVYLSQDEGLFEFFVEEVSKHFKIKDCRKITFKQIRKSLIEELSVYYNTNISELTGKQFNELIESKSPPEGLKKLFSTFNGDIDFRDSVKLKKKGFLKSIFLNKSNWTRFKGIERLINTDFANKVLCLSGEIIIPLEKDQLEKIRNGDCFSTILDGGLIKFKKLKSDISIENFIKVSEISTETKPFNYNKNI